MQRLLAVCAVVSGAILSTASAAYASTPHAPVTCVLDGTRASVHWMVSTRPGTSKGQLAGVAIAGISTTGCADPLPATVTIRGIPSGDTAVTPTETLTVLDSATDPCTGKPLPNPQFLVNGAITLRACVTGGPGPLAPVLDATRLTLRVAGMPVTIGGDAGGGEPVTGDSPASTNGSPPTKVLGEKSRRSPGTRGQHTEPHQNAVASLPFTGSWIARSVVLSSALVLLGLTLALIRRRRTNAGVPDGR